MCQPSGCRRSGAELQHEPFAAKDDSFQIGQRDRRVDHRDRPPVELQRLPQAGAALADQAGRREVAEVRVLPEPGLRFVADAAELVLRRDGKSSLKLQTAALPTLVHVQPRACHE